MLNHRPIIGEHMSDLLIVGFFAFCALVVLILRAFAVVDDEQD